MNKEAVAKNALTFLILFSIVLIIYFFLTHGLNVNSEFSGTVNGINENYDSLTNTVILTNSASSVLIANITLNTPKVYNVIRGKDRLVAEFTIDNSNEISTSNVFNNMEFYDVKNNLNKIDRTFLYKYETFENVDVPDYQTNCKDRVSDNGTAEKYDCVQVQTGTHTEQKAIWNSFDDKAALPAGSITIGIFTDVLPNDYVEWVPTFYGVRVNEWASWTESLNNGLISVHQFSESSGTNTQDMINSSLNGTLINDVNFVQGGINGNAVNISGGNNYVNISNPMGISGTDPFTINLWAWMNVAGGTWAPFSSHIQVTTAGSIGSDGTPGEDSRLWFYTGSVSHRFADYPNSLDSGVWQMVTFIRNSTNDCVYINGTLRNCDAMSGSVTPDGWYLGRQTSWSGAKRSLLDELYIWNRTLSDAEISSLYDGGIGTFYQQNISNQTNNGYISWDGDFMTSGKINSSDIINAEMGYSVQGQMGITNNTGFWMCKDANCSAKCQADIRGGIIVGCS